MKKNKNLSDQSENEDFLPFGPSIYRNRDPREDLPGRLFSDQQILDAKEQKMNQSRDLSNFRLAARLDYTSIVSRGSEGIEYILDHVLVKGLPLILRFIRENEYSFFFLFDFLFAHFRCFARSKN